MEVKTNPFYELRNRLYASAAAGCSLIAEDFRLKRAIEAFQPMSEANKVFGKLYAMCNALLVSENKPADIIDCIALADALAVTQGTFADSSETEPAKPMKMLAPSHMTIAALEEYKEKIRKTPYAEQDFGADFYKHIADPRLMSSFLEISGKNGGGTADLLIMLGAVYGEDIVQVYFDMLDHADEKANGNQLRYIADTYRDKYNEDYIRYAEDENVPQGIRIAAIEAMAYSAENDERLTVLYKTSKGKIKNAALLSLCRINSDTAKEQIKKMVEKPKMSYYEFFAASGSEEAEKYAVDSNNHLLERLSKKDSFVNGVFDGGDQNIISMLSNKKNVKDSFMAYGEYFKKFNVSYYLYDNDAYSVNLPLINNIISGDDKEYRDMIDELYNIYPDLFFESEFIVSLIDSPENVFEKLGENAVFRYHRVYDIFYNIINDANGWYYIKYCDKYIKLFQSIPDDMLRYLTDLSYITEENIKNTDTSEESNYKKHPAFVKYRLDILSRLIRISCSDERERIISAAEAYAWDCNSYAPTEAALCFLGEYSKRDLKGLFYDYVMYSLQNKGPVSSFDLRNITLPSEVLIKDTERLMETLEEFLKNNKNTESVSKQLNEINFYYYHCLKK